MKKSRFIFLILLAAGVGSGCLAGLSSLSSPSTTPTAAPTLAAPSSTAIKAAIILQNRFGIVANLSMGSIVLPECTKSDGSAIDFSATYSISSLPSWLAFDAATRTLSLTGTTSVPSSSRNTRLELSYTCIATDAPTVTQSATFAFNDYDDDRIVDTWEYLYAGRPIVDASGWIWVTPGNSNIYSGDCTALLHPTGLDVTSLGLDFASTNDVTADIDGDGISNLDEFIAGTNVFVRTSDGTFGANTDYNAVAGGFSSLIVFDANADGHLDFASAARGFFLDSTQVSFFLNNGDGTFANSSDIAMVDQPFGITAGDLNCDGAMDLVVASADDLSTPGDINDGNRVGILLGRGNGTFQAVTTFSTSSQPSPVVLGDIDGDGALDVIIGKTGGTVSAHLGNGSGSFGSEIGSSSGGLLIAELLLADYDGNGQLDIFAIGSNGIGLLLGQGDGTFQAAETVLFGSFLSNAILADFNYDGRLDIAINDLVEDTLSIVLMTGSSLLTNVQNRMSYTTLDSPLDIVASDFNGDVNIDLALINTGAGVNAFSIFLGNGDGTFRTRADYATGIGPDTLAAGDFNGDGKIDLINMNSFSTVSVHLNQ